MLTVHSTKKLLAKLPVDDQGILPMETKAQPFLLHDHPSDNDLGQWHANLLTLQRRNCVLFVHDATRFPVFLPCLTKPDFARLDWWFCDSLMNTILKCGANESQMDAASQALQRLQFDTQTDRSVQGTMNQMALDVEHSLYVNNGNIGDIAGAGYRLGAWLADRPTKIKSKKDHIWPIQEFFALLDSFPTSGKTDQLEQKHEQLPDNVISLDRYRQRN